MTSPAERVRGVSALVALLVLVGGVPWALVAWRGDPLPGSAPSAAWLAEPLSGDALLGVLTVVVWCAWAHFVACVVREVVVQHRFRGRGAARAGGHPLARRLVASVLLMLGTVTVTAQTAQAAGNSPAPRTGASVVAVAVEGAHDVAVVAGQAADEATDVKASQSRVQGETAVSHGRSAGVRHELGLRYKVQPPHARHHDSLWDIAERMLGDGRRWTDLFELNKDRLQDDGHRLQDADLIYPGWELALPDDARGRDVVGLSSADTPVPSTSGSGRAQVASTDRYDTADPHSPVARGVVAAAASGDVPGAELAMAGGLVTAGLLLGLRRRRGWDGGPPRGRGATLADEQALHLAADVPSASVADRGLRQLSSHLGRGPRPAPVLRTARVNPRGFT
ncbi:MAG: LysM peptidoglycan-binding domain-containing protein, partial [Nocardioidaceae bacterium]